MDMYLTRGQSNPILFQKKKYVLKRINWQVIRSLKLNKNVRITSG